MSAPTPDQLRAMAGERLRDEGRKADRALGAEIDRLQIADERFRSILKWSQDVEAEQMRRRGQ